MKPNVAYIALFTSFIRNTNTKIIEANKAITTSATRKAQSKIAMKIIKPLSQGSIGNQSSILFNYRFLGYSKDNSQYPADCEYLYPRPEALVYRWIVIGIGMEIVGGIINHP
jgi:hypothetical protein